MNRVQPMEVNNDERTREFERLSLKLGHVKDDQMMAFAKCQLMKQFFKVLMIYNSFNM
jgi:hypothetical protein